MSASWNGKVALVKADARPGRYYVTIKDGPRTAYALGPFVQHTYGKEAHARALGAVRSVRRYIQSTPGYPRESGYAYGTAWMPLYGKAPDGKLNAAIARPL